jgi:hypothetical protein
MRLVGRIEPTRIYTRRFEDDTTAGEVPWLHHRRRPYNELRIRDLIRGANLNVNYGYTYRDVPNRTRQRKWEGAQAKVAVTERQSSNHQTAVHNLRQRLASLQDTHAAAQRDQERQLAQCRLNLRRRQRLGKATVRAQQQVDRSRRELSTHTQRFLRRQRRLLQQLSRREAESRQLRERLTQRIAVCDAIDTETLCRERDLEKDQIMLDFQVLLANLHDWVAQNYLTPKWRTLSLKKALQMIYRKAGQVTWYDDHIKVELEPYRYPDQQCKMEATCARFNAANLCWRDGRLLCITVALPG